MPEDRFEPERRRLASMLPGARIERIDTSPWASRLQEEGLGDHAPHRPGASGSGSRIRMVAEVDDLDQPIPVLVERGGYAYPADINAALDGRRWLRWPATGDTVYELHLVRRSA